MQVKKLLSGCLITSGIIFIVIGVLIIYWLFSPSKKQIQAEKDREKYAAVCNTIPYVTEQPQISFNWFQPHEIDTLKFQILREGKLIRDSIIAAHYTYISSDRQSLYRSMKIPYEHFLKTDTIVVTTKHPLYYKISGYHHYPYQHYGMFGYLGSHDCRFSESCTVNNRENTYHGTLSKYEGWKSLDSIPERIYKDMPKFTELEKTLMVKYKDAYSIFVRKTDNASPLDLYYEEGSYYMVDASSTGNLKVVKINASTGEYTELKDFP